MAESRDELVVLPEPGDDDDGEEDDGDDPLEGENGDDDVIMPGKLDETPAPPLDLELHAVTAMMASPCSTSKRAEPSQMNFGREQIS